MVNNREILLADAFGRNFPLKLIGQIGKQTITLDVSGLITGIYFIKFKTVEGYRTILLVKE